MNILEFLWSKESQTDSMKALFGSEQVVGNILRLGTVTPLPTPSYKKKNTRMLWWIYVIMVRALNL